MLTRKHLDELIDTRHMLEGNLNRLNLAENIEDLDHNFKWALRNVLRIYELNDLRIKNIERND